MRTLPFKSVIVLAVIGLGGLASCSRSNYAQSGETDDLYFSSSDRKVAKYASSTEIAGAQSANNQRNMNPDYLSQYNQQSQQYNQNNQTQDNNGDTYYDPNYQSSDLITADNTTLGRRRTTSYGYNSIYPNYNAYNYYGNSWYDPYWSNNWGWNRWNSWGYDPFWGYNSWGPGVRISVGWGGGWGWNRWNRWNNWGWYDPYWGGGWYSPYSYSYGWYGGGWYGRNVWVNNNYYYGNNNYYSRPRSNSGSVTDNGLAPRYGSRAERSTEVVNRNVDNTPRTDPRGGRVDASQSSGQPAYSTRSSPNYGSRGDNLGDNPSRSGARTSEQVYTNSRNSEFSQPVRPRGVESRNYGSRSNDINNSYDYRSSGYSSRGSNSNWSNSNSGYSAPQRSSGYGYRSSGNSNNGGYSSTPQYSEPSRSTRSSSPSWGGSSNSGGWSGGGSRSSGSSGGWSGGNSSSGGGSHGGSSGRSSSGSGSSGGGVRPR